MHKTLVIDWLTYVEIFCSHLLWATLTPRPYSVAYNACHNPALWSVVVSTMFLHLQ